MNLTILKPSIFAVLFLLFSQQVWSQAFDDESSGRTLALIIGISNYQNIDSLKFADKDALDFANYLSSEEGMSLPDTNIMLLTNEEATKSTIIYKGLNWLSEELKPNDQAYIFYSGHGDVTRANSEQDVLKTGYLLTYESERDKYETTALEMELFLRKFHVIATAKKATIRVIMDVCHSGIGMKSGGILNMLQMMGKFDKEKQIVVTSCKYDQLSYEYDALQNGVFTYFLIQGLKGGADVDKDEIITLEELKEYASSNVKRYVKKRNNERQSPEFEGSESHWLGFIPEAYEAPDLERIHDNASNEQGAKKGIDRAAPVINPEVVQAIKGLENSKGSYDDIQRAYELYDAFSAITPDQQTVKRNMRRNLVALMIEKADKLLTDYFQEESGITSRPSYEIVTDYYLKSAELLGEEHYQYNETLAKYFFLDALRLKSRTPNNPKVLDKLNTSLTLEPNASYTLNELGNVYLAKGEREKALDYYQRATNISPTWGKNVIKLNKTRTDQKYKSTQAIPTSYGYSSSNINTKTKSSKKLRTEDIEYHIQLSATGAINRDRFKKIETYGSITPVYNEEKNVIYSRMGPFQTDKQAKSILNKIRQQGFQDAFVIELPKDNSFQRKLSEKEDALNKEIAITSPYQIRLAAVKNFHKEDFAKLENIGNIEALPATVNGKSIYRVILPANTKQEANSLLGQVKRAGYKDAYIFTNTNPGTKSNTNSGVPTAYDTVSNGAYRIQLASVSKLSDKQFSNLEGLGKIYVEVVPEKDMIRAYLGDFSSKIKASSVLKKVKAKGYKDAFVQKRD